MRCQWSAPVRTVVFVVKTISSVLACKTSVRLVLIVYEVVKFTNGHFHDCAVRCSSQNGRLSRCDAAKFSTQPLILLPTVCYFNVEDIIKWIPSPKYICCPRAIVSMPVALTHTPFVLLTSSGITLSVA